MSEHKLQHVAITFDDGSVGVMAFVLDPRIQATAEEGAVTAVVEQVALLESRRRVEEDPVELAKIEALLARSADIEARARAAATASLPPGFDRTSGQREASDAAIAHEIARSAWDARTVVSWRRLDAAGVPADRAFRDAWRDVGGRLSVHMPTARAIHRDRLRALRAPKLFELDVAYMRAFEDGDTAAMKQVAAQKQALRDAPAHPDIEKAKTPDQLKAVVPDALRT